MPKTESKAVAVQAAPKIAAATMEKVLIQGDLKALTPVERVAYYDSVCKSLGLNPLTRPFDYLTLNGKLLLYAKRECTDQLRKIHAVTVKIRAREVMDGCFVVTAGALLPDGREDESIGAVTIDGLKGDSKSNAMMKAETKAKRRVTLSICGMAFLDETEVEGVRGATPANIDPETGEILAEAVRPWTSFKGMLQCFADLKARLGGDHTVYYEILQMSGVAHSNEFRDPETALKAYHTLLAAVEERETARATVEVEDHDGKEN